MASRRGFLAGLFAATSVPRLGWAAVGSPKWLAAARRGEDAYVLCGLSETGQIVFAVALPARGHAGAGHPERAVAIVFARRPGAYALVIDCVSGRVLHRLSPPVGLEFNGHGTFLDQGRLLASSEQRAEDSEGMIGLWETTGWTRVGQFPSGGIGPHDLRLMPDGQTLVVANGGIATGPGDRVKLNIPVMQPSLAYLTTGGTLLETIALQGDLHRNSIRHLAVRADGLVAFAMQWEGDPQVSPPLLGLHRRSEPAVLASAPPTEDRLMQGYAGSLAMTGTGSEIILTSPKGGRAHRFDAGGTFLGGFDQADVCGIAPDGDAVLTSDGLGTICRIIGGTRQEIARHPLAWDNHIVALERESR